jgi:HEAT repeat protein
MVLRTPMPALILALAIASSAYPQEPLRPADLYTRFDNEHDLAKKERLLGQITDEPLSACTTLLRIAEHTENLDTRWMAMRGMATVHCKACAEFLEGSLRDPDATVRANAARALGDLRVTASGPKIQAMFAAEKDPSAIEQASLALHMLNVRAAAPYIRIKIPNYTWQTRAWLLQALGALGGPDDVPLIAEYLNSSDKASAMAATAALEELTGISFGPQLNGPSSYPTASMLAARKWWSSHEAVWPDCDDCRYK